MVKKALNKSTLREIRQSLGRYMAILAIIAIGVAIFSGLHMSQPSMIETGVKYLEEYKFHDFRLISTLGLTEEDVESFENLDGIELARGAVFSEFLWDMNGEDISVLMAHSITEGVNLPELMAGRMPKKGNECLADAHAFSEKDIGKTIKLSAINDEDTAELFAYDEYTIVGLANNPIYLNYERGTATIGSGSIYGFILLPPEAFHTDIYYEIYLRVSQRADAYSDDYKPIIDSIKPHVEELLDTRADLRHDTLYSDAAEQISDGEAELAEGWEEYRSEKAKAEAELLDAKQKLDEGEEEYAEGLKDYNTGLYEYNKGRKEYDDGLAELTEAEDTLTEGRAEYEKAKTEAQAKLSDALAQLESGETEYADGLKQYQDSLAQFEEAPALIEENEKLLADAKKQLDEAKIQLDEGREQIEMLHGIVSEAKQALNAAEFILSQEKRAMDRAQRELDSMSPDDPDYAAKAAELAALKITYESSLATYNGAKAIYDELYPQYEDAQLKYSSGLAQYNNGLRQYEEGMAQLNAAKKQLESAPAQLESARLQLEDARKELDKGWMEYYDGLAEAEEEFAKAEEELSKGEKELAEGKEKLEEAKLQLDDAKIQLTDAQLQLSDGRKELDDGWEEYNDGKAEAEREFTKAEAELLDAEADIAEAYTELEKLKDADRYVLTRSENTGYACFDSDTSIIAAISVVFPFFFFLVAALVCMTTMKRMVDEQRTQIGVLKAIGYSRGQINGKYLFYSGSAAVIGCVLGYILGSTCLPLVLWEIYGIMYGFAPLEFVFDPWLALGTVAASLLCSMGATYLSCMAELKRPAAELIRPKTPKAGKRVFLEYITPLWKHLNFLQKVSVRNVLRYRSRFIMMVIGIGGCTALLITGFGINDSIANIASDQYGEISHYDYAVSFTEPLDSAGMDEYLVHMGLQRERGLLVHSGSTDIIAEGGSKTIYLVSPAENSLEGFITLSSNGEALPFPAPGQAVINDGLAEDLGVNVGDNISLRSKDMGEISVTVSGLCDNYISNYVYVSPETYVQQLGLAPEMNTVFVNSDSGQDANEESVRLSDYEGVGTVSASATARDRLTTSLERLNLIVVVVVVCSGALAFVVLYNLTNINITERVREIATVKVLGFYPGETAKYIFREVNILSAVGSIAGLFMGKALHSFVMAQVQVEAIFFPSRILPLSYALSFVITMIFTILITNCMRPKLNGIDMAESLKSIE